MTTTTDLITAMKDRIVRDFHPLQILLFGSQARGNAGPGSDVDLLVALPEVPDRRKAAIEIRRALAGFPVSKDTIVTTPDEIARRGDLVGTILRPALREGQVLYERIGPTLEPLHRRQIHYSFGQRADPLQ